MKAERKIARALDRELEAQGPLLDRQGLVVDTSDLQWRLNSVTRGRSAALSWRACGNIEPLYARAIVAFMRFNVERKSPDHCLNVFRELAGLTLTIEAHAAQPIRDCLFAYLTKLRTLGSEWRFHYVRDWYKWCYHQAQPGFDDISLYHEMVSMRIPGNVKGEAVRSNDPTEGPLEDIEIVALRAALLRDDGPLLERAIVWALLAFGSNPANLVYLCEEDFKAVHVAGSTFYVLDVPRIKKRGAPRQQFRTRKLDETLANLFEALIARNADIGIPVGYSRPLFSRPTPRAHCVGTSIERFAYHYTSEDIKTLLRRCVKRLSIVSPRTGEPLEISPRRLRYTFATRKVQEGCAMEALADLLDHTDLQSVSVYYSGRGITKRLDEAIAVTVGPLVNRFMGRVVDGEHQCLDQGGTIKAQPLGRIVDIGTCGSTSLCSLFPPASCYVCPLFQPWKNGPHRDVLVDLLRKRDERISLTGRDDDRIAAQYDEMILAVGQVVAICEAES